MLPAPMLFEERVPVSWLVATTPLKLAARMAYGVAVRRCARNECGVGAGAHAGSHRDFQPAITSRKGRRAEVERGGEQPIGHGEIVDHIARPHGDTAGGGVVEREGEVSRAFGRAAAFIEAPLIGEGGVLGTGDIAQHEQRGKDSKKRTVFHLFLCFRL